MNIGWLKEEHVGAKLEIDVTCYAPLWLYMLQEIVELLLDAGADSSRLSVDGRTALALAEEALEGGRVIQCVFLPTVAMATCLSLRLLVMAMFENDSIDIISLTYHPPLTTHMSLRIESTARTPRPQPWPRSRSQPQPVAAL